MRISHTMLTEAAARTLSGLKERLAKVQGQIAGGEVTGRASDDPYRATAAMEWQALQRRTERAEAAAEDARDWLAAAEDAMTRLVNAMQQGRELSVSGRSALSPEARNAVAQEVDQLRAETLVAVRTQHRGIYLFAGHRVDTVPFVQNAPGGVDYAGDNGAPEVEVLPGVRVATRVPGGRLLAGGDFYRILGDLATALRAGDNQGIAQQQAALDGALAAVSGERSAVGVRMRTLEEYADMARTTQVQLEEHLSNAVGTDLTRAALQLAQEETTYRAALAAASRALPPSLMDWLGQ